MKKIGLTGGIGSGKTTIAEIIQHLGYPVYIADKEASFLMETHEGIRKNLTQRFGTAVYTTEGHINKPVLAKIIFENRKALQEVNRIVHPCVMEAFTGWCHRQTSPLAFCESAILYEGGLEKYFDAIICVTAPEDVRLARVMQRDQTTEQNVKGRIRNQLDDTLKCQRADFVICNDGKHLIIPQLITIIQKLQAINQ